MTQNSQPLPIAFVLNQPQNELNIGASLRALTNFAVAELRVVRHTPIDFDLLSVTATRSASRAESIRSFSNLIDALEDQHQVFALTSRPRHDSLRVYAPHEAAVVAVRAAQNGQRVSFLFGQEDHGLSNEAIDRATAMVRIPTTSLDYASLNLAQAVLLMAWEVFSVSEGIGYETSDPRLPSSSKDVASRGKIERMLEVAEASLHTINFFKFGDGAHVMRSLRHQFARLKPTSREVSIWFGIFSEIETYGRRLRDDPTDPQL